MGRFKKLNKINQKSTNWCVTDLAGVAGEDYALLNLLIEKGMAEHRVLRFRCYSSAFAGGLRDECCEHFTREGANLILKWLQDINLKYRPWQFNVQSQIDGSFDMDCVEAQKSLHKYAKENA